MHSEALGPGRRGKDALSYCGPNGGGYGDPLNRPPRKVLEDVLGGYCSADHARTVYGVAIGLDAETVDLAATEKLRGDAQAEQGPRKAAPCAWKTRCGWFWRNGPHSLGQPDPRGPGPRHPDAQALHRTQRRGSRRRLSAARNFLLKEGRILECKTR